LLEGRREEEVESAGVAHGRKVLADEVEGPDLGPDGEEFGHPPDPLVVDPHPGVSGLGRERPRLEEGGGADGQDHLGRRRHCPLGGPDRMLAQGEPGEGGPAERVAGAGRIELAHGHARHVGGMPALHDARSPLPPRDEEEPAGIRTGRVEAAEERTGLLFIAEEHVGLRHRPPNLRLLLRRRPAVGAGGGPAAAGLHRAKEIELALRVEERDAIHPFRELALRQVCGSELGLGAPDCGPHGGPSLAVVGDLEVRQLLGGDGHADPLDPLRGGAELGRHRVGARTEHGDESTRPTRGKRGVEAGPARRALGASREMEPVERGAAHYEETRGFTHLNHC